MTTIVLLFIDYPSLRRTEFERGTLLQPDDLVARGDAADHLSYSLKARA
jgi:hypothetical protein